MSLMPSSTSLQLGFPGVLDESQPIWAMISGKLKSIRRTSSAAIVMLFVLLNFYNSFPALIAHAHQKPAGETWHGWLTYDINKNSGSTSSAFSLGLLAFSIDNEGIAFSLPLETIRSKRFVIFANYDYRRVIEF